MSTPQFTVVGEADTPAGLADIVVDPHRPSGRILRVDTVPQSYVDIEDDSFLLFDYALWTASVIDGLAPAGRPIRALHLGGGALSLPRYVEATRPGSHQLVAEPNEPMHRLVVERLPLPDGADLTVRAVDGQDLVAAQPDDSFDLVINDAYHGNQMPGDIAGTGFVAEAARVLRPDGVYLINVNDSVALVLTKIQLATVATGFAHPCLVAAHTAVHGREYGNTVVAGTNRPGGFPAAAVAEAAAARDLALPLVHGETLAPIVAAAEPLEG